MDERIVLPPDRARIVYRCLHKVVLEGLGLSQEEQALVLPALCSIRDQLERKAEQQGRPWWECWA